MRYLIIVVLLLLAPALVFGQSSQPAAGTNRDQNAPGSAGPKDSGAVQHGAQPNAGEVRAGNRDGDSPSASAGVLARDPVVRRIFGLPVTTVLVIGAVILGLLVLGGLAIPAARRRDQARGGGTYGRSGRA
ncbi:MAG TPA: hypothetical protein VGL09_10930 [Methylomirabilota bacterium]